MKTFAKIGRDALMRLFAEKEIFSKTNLEKEKVVKRLPRQIFVPKKPVNLKEEFLGFQVIVYEKIFKIYVWNAEIGLKEVIPGKNGGKLMDLILGTLEEPIYLSHIVIVKKTLWEKNSESFTQEEVNIYSLTNKQKMEIYGHLSWIDHINS